MLGGRMATNIDIVLLIMLLCAVSLCVMDWSAVSHQQANQMKDIVPVCSDSPECVSEFVGVHVRVMRTPPIWTLVDFRRMFPSYSMAGVPENALDGVLFVVVASEEVVVEVRESWGSYGNLSAVYIPGIPERVSLETVLAQVKQFAAQGTVQWFFLTLGPAVVFPEKLLLMLDGIDSRSPIAVSHLWQMHGSDYPKVSVGSGVAISARAMELVIGAEFGDCPMHSDLSDSLSSCFWDRGVFLAHSNQIRVAPRVRGVPSVVMGSSSGVSPPWGREVCNGAVSIRDPDMRVKVHWLECRMWQRYGSLGGSAGPNHSLSSGWRG